MRMFLGNDFGQRQAANERVLCGATAPPFVSRSLIVLSTCSARIWNDLSAFIFSVVLKSVRCSSIFIHSFVHSFIHYRQDLPEGQLCQDIVFTHRPIFRFFAPQGRHVAPIKVKFVSRSSLSNFTLIGSDVWVYGPKNFENLEF